VGNEDCVACGLRKPGLRPRELAILESAAAALRAPSSAELDFSAARRFPVRRRPSAAEAEAMRDGAPLLRLMNTDSTLFRRVRYLLPERFRIAPAGSFQPQVDEAVLRLASTDAGKKAVCAFAVDSARDVETYLQVSPAAAKKVRAGCKGYPVPPAVAARLRVIREARPPFQPTPLVPAKKFVFVFSETGRPAIEGYTAKNNTTYLVLTKETADPDTLLRMISHELAVSYDQLSRLGYLSNPSTIEDMGVGLAFGKSNLDPHVFVDPAPAELERMKCAFRDPALRYAATAQRAFRFEDAVSAELGGSPAVAAGGTCSEILAKNSVLLQAMARAVSWDTGWYEAACGIAKEPAARLEQVLGRIRTIEATNLTCRNPKDCGGQRRVSLCNVLLEPRIGPNAQDLDSGGPRPRMGGGWDGAALEREDLILRASAGGGLSPEEARALGGALLFPNIDELHREEDGRALPARPGSRASKDEVSL
jgi:hypothetical protein